MKGISQMAVKNVTIYDIAEEADVSPATVSRVLTGSANVRQDKKKRVVELIQKYNFKPSAVARSLTDTRRKLIGIIAADVRNVFYADVYVACEIAADQLGIDEDDIKLESNFKEDLEADSLDLFELVMALEEEYGVEIPSEDLEKIATVNDIIEYLKNKGVEA